MSVHPSLCPSITLKKNVIISGPILYKWPKILVMILLINAHLFYTYFVCLSVGNSFTTYVRTRLICVSQALQ